MGEHCAVVAPVNFGCLRGLDLSCLDRQSSLRSTSLELVFDVEIDTRDKRRSLTGGDTKAVPEAFLKVLKQWGTPTNVFCTQVLKDIQDVKTSSSATPSKMSPRALGCALSALGYKVKIRTGRGGKDDSLFTELRHEFLVVYLESSGSWEADAELVVEPNFRDHFLIPCPTTCYKQVLSMIPEEYVGPPHRLADLVRLLCREMASSFATSGHVLPPWRHYQSMISRWRPRIHKDEFLPESLAAADSDSRDCAPY